MYLNIYKEKEKKKKKLPQEFITNIRSRNKKQIIKKIRVNYAEKIKIKCYQRAIKKATNFCDNFLKKTKDDKCSDHSMSSMSSINI